jgi:hypothetical protein
MDVILLFALDDGGLQTAAHGGVRWVDGATYQSALRRGPTRHFENRDSAMPRPRCDDARAVRARCRPATSRTRSPRACALGPRRRCVCRGLEVGIRRSCRGKVSQPGAITVNARKLYEIVRELPSDCPPRKPRFPVRADRRCVCHGGRQRAGLRASER